MTIQVDKVLEEVLPTTNWYIVLRPFVGDSHNLIAGEIVDTSSWKHKKSLEQRRIDDLSDFPNSKVAEYHGKEKDLNGPGMIYGVMLYGRNLVQENQA